MASNQFLPAGTCMYTSLYVCMCVIHNAECVYSNCMHNAHTIPSRPGRIIPIFPPIILSYDSPKTSHYSYNLVPIIPELFSILYPVLHTNTCRRTETLSLFITLEHKQSLHIVRQRAVLSF